MRRGAIELCLAVLLLCGCGDGAGRPGAGTVGQRTTPPSARSTAPRSYRFVGAPLVLGLPDGGPPTVYGGTTAEVDARLRRRPPGTGHGCALRVDAVGGEECERRRPLDGGRGVCMRAYLGMRAGTPLYEKGAGDRVQVRLDLDGGASRVVVSVAAHGITSTATMVRLIHRLGCPL